MIKKGAALAVWMYVLHEFEDAIKDCTTGDITANDDEVHAWDEGWAFYAGSLTGENHPAADKGQLLYGLAQSRADNFGTTTNDVANANTVALAAATAGRTAPFDAGCSKAWAEG